MRARQTTGPKKVDVRHFSIGAQTRGLNGTQALAPSTPFNSKAPSMLTLLIFSSFCSFMQGVPDHATLDPDHHGDQATTASAAIHTRTHHDDHTGALTP